MQTTYLAAMINALILGASGYVGGELLRLLAAHPHIQPTLLIGDSDAGKRVADVHPALALAYPNAIICSFDKDMLRDSDLVFAALPHGKSLRNSRRTFSMRTSISSIWAPISGSIPPRNMRVGTVRRIRHLTCSTPSPTVFPNFIALELRGPNLCLPRDAMPPPRSWHSSLWSTQD